MKNLDIKKLVTMNLMYLVIKGVLLFYGSLFFSNLIIVDSFATLLKVLVVSELGVILSLIYIEMNITIEKLGDKKHINSSKESKGFLKFKGHITTVLIFIVYVIFGYLELYLSMHFIKGFAVNSILAFVILGLIFDYYQIWLPKD